MPAAGEVTVGLASHRLHHASQTSVVYPPIRAHGLKKGDEPTLLMGYDTLPSAVHVVANSVLVCHMRGINYNCTLTANS